MNTFYKISLLFLLISNFTFAQQSFIKHRVGKGETIAQISKKYDLTENDIFKLNPESQKGVKENSVIFIPNSKTHVVLPKETIYGLANRYNIKIEDLKNANPTIELNGMKIGQSIKIPNISNKNIQSENKINNKIEITSSGNHIVKPKETLFSIARDYNVLVADLDEFNKSSLNYGLKIGQEIKIPAKKINLNIQKQKNIDPNPNTIFYTVGNKDTKYAIAKKYNMTVQELESQNPEIGNVLQEGQKLSVIIKKDEPKISNQTKENPAEAEKNKLAENKLKEKQLEIEGLQDKLAVQKEMNAKVLKVNSLGINLKDIDEKKGGSVAKLKLVLKANKDVQDLLLTKLDSLVYTVNEDVEKLKTTEFSDIENAKLLENQSAEKIAQTNEVLMQLKRDMAENRKNYSLLVNKIQIANQEENSIYKKSVREAGKNNPNDQLFEDIDKIKNEQEKNEKLNNKLLTKIDALNTERNIELKKRIKMATFYSEEARTYDDKIAEEKLKRYRRNAETKQKIVLTKETKLNTKMFSNTVNIQVFKNLDDVKKGFYLVTRVFKDAKERDAFVMKLIDSGDINASFFYDFNTFSYYVFSDIFKTVGEALSAFKQKDNTKYHEKMFIVNIKEKDKE